MIFQLPPVTFAVTVKPFDGGGGDDSWFTAANWDNDAAPSTTGATVNLADVAGTTNVLFDADGYNNPSSVTVSAISGDEGLSLTSGLLLVDGNSTLGGTITLNGGRLGPALGDTLTLTLRAEAEPGVELWMPEFGQALDRFRILDFAPGESVDADGRSHAVQRYSLEPSRSGTLHIPALAGEFVDRRPGRPRAPDGEDAFEILTERLEVEVAGLAPQDAAAALRPMPGELTSIRVGRRSLWLAFTLGLVLSVAAAAGAWAWRARRGVARRASAWEIAHAELDALVREGLPGDDRDAVSEFFVHLSGIVRRYLEARFELRSPELTTEEFLEVASRSPDLDDGLRGVLTEFLRRADRVKFARFLPARDEVSASVEAARRVLEQTRESLPSTDAPAHDLFLEGSRG